MAAMDSMASSRVVFLKAFVEKARSSMRLILMDSTTETQRHKEDGGWRMEGGKGIMGLRGWATKRREGGRHGRATSFLVARCALAVVAVGGESGSEGGCDAPRDSAGDEAGGGTDCAAGA